MLMNKCELSLHSAIQSWCAGDGTAKRTLSQLTTPPPTPPHTQPLPSRSQCNVHFVTPTPFPSIPSVPFSARFPSSDARRTGITGAAGTPLLFPCLGVPPPHSASPLDFTPRPPRLVTLTHFGLLGTHKLLK